MEIQKSSKRDFIKIFIAVLFAISIPISVSAEDTTSSTSAQDSDINGIAYISSQSGSDSETEIQGSDVDTQVSTEDADAEEDVSSKSSDSTEESDEEDDAEALEPESIEPEMTTMSMGMGGAGTSDEEGVFSTPAAVSAVYTGAATYSIPIVVPPGRKGIQPNLALTYNSYRGNGWLGVGWDLDLGSIQRSTRRGVDYQGDEYVAGGSKLVPRSDWGDNYYGAKIEGGFSKYYKNTSTGGWEVTASNGTTYFYGSDEDSRQYNGSDIFKWCLDRVEDTNGNYMEVTYIKDSGQIYPQEIEYTGNGVLSPTKSVEFILSDRDYDAQISYKTMYPVTTAKLLTEIIVEADSQLVRKYLLNYDDNNPKSKRSRLSGVQIMGSDGSSTLPEITFDWYDGGDVTFQDSYITYMNNIPGALTFGDIDGNGTADLIKYYALERSGESDARVYVYPFLSEGDSTFTDLDLMELSPADPDGVSVHLGDVDGDLLADIVSNGTDGDVNTYLSDGQGDFSDAITSEGPSTDAILLADIDGDGLMDLIRHDFGGTVYSCLAEGDGSFKESGYGTHTGTGGAGEGLIRLADLNGDGYSDLIKLDGSDTAYTYLSQGDGTFSTTADGYVSGLGDEAEYIALGDVNGDGLADIVKNDCPYTQKIYTFLSKGDGSFTDQITAVDTNCYSGEMSLADVNGDGLTDIVKSPNYYNFTFLSRGDGTFDLFFSEGPHGEGVAYFADVNGDGMADLIKANPGDNCACVSLALGDGPADHLRTVENELGGTVTITYSNSSEYADNYLPFIIHPVSSIETDDGNDVVSETSFTYSGGLYEYEFREFWGFEYVKQTNPDGTTKETWYHQDDEYTRGRPQEIQIKEPGAQNYFKKTEFVWDQYPGTETDYKFVNLSQKVTEDIIGSETVIVQEDYTYYDDDGYVYLHTAQTSSSTSPGETITKTNIYENQGAWVWRLTQETITGSSSGKVRETYYTYESDTGNMLTKTYWLDIGTDPEIEMDYDAYGNVISLTDANGNTTETDYDSTDTYPETITYPTTGSVSHVVEMEWDDLYGKLILKTDQNGNDTDYTYDEFGRLEQVDYPDGGQILYDYHDDVLPRYIITRVKESSSSYIDNYVYYDGFGRPIQSVSYGEDEKLIVTRAYYDDMGRNYKTEGPYFATGSPTYPITHPSEYPFMEMTFDYRGRPEEVESPDSSGGFYRVNAVECDYDGLNITVTDPDGKQTSEERDYLGRIIKVEEHTSGGTYETTYEYNAAGDLLEVEDDAGNSTDIDYDSLSRKKDMTDPDMGYWQYTYDANGNLLTQTDAKSQTITFTYDELNRVTTKTYSTSDPTVTFTYDNLSIDNGIGRLYSVTNGNTTTTINGYDVMGRTVSVTKTITGDTARTTEYEYDLSGKAIEVTYPDGFYTTNVFHPGTNLLDTVTGSDSIVYANISDYEPTGKMGRIDHENETYTEYSYDSWSTRLTGIVTKDSGDSTIQSKAYEYSSAGDITEIEDLVDGITYTYDYDDLHRLTDEDNTGSYDDISLSYNAIGNITSKTIGSNTFSFYYDASHKHAVDYITFNSQDYNYTYDANGNMTYGPDFTNPSDIKTRTISYNADNMPVEIIHSSGVTTDIVYDGVGSRVKKSVDTGSSTIDTYYIGDHFEVQKVDTTETVTKYIFAGNLRVAQIEGSTLNFFHKDHLGSSTVMTDNSGYEVESSNYMPFGGMRDHSGTETSNYKFTDQELDAENGLYNYGARLYDPIIGRFLSPDPIVPQPYNPQSLNRYSYCLNNPLIYVDPSGYKEAVVVLDLGDFQEGGTREWSWGDTDIEVNSYVFTIGWYVTYAGSGYYDVYYHAEQWLWNSGFITCLGQVEYFLYSVYYSTTSPTGGSSSSTSSSSTSSGSNNPQESTQETVEDIVQEANGGDTGTGTETPAAPEPKTPSVGEKIKAKVVDLGNNFINGVKSVFRPVTYEELRAEVQREIGYTGREDMQQSLKNAGYILAGLSAPMVVGPIAVGASEAYPAVMVAAGTPQGQYALNIGQEFALGFFTEGPPNHWGGVVGSVTRKSFDAVTGLSD